METVLPLKAGELEQAIVRPANMTGVTYEPGLVAAIIDDVLYQPGALPLLQYALTELFAARDGRFLTHAAYQAIGGATGALARRAEELYREQDSSGRELLRQLFLRLVFVGEGDEADPDTRRRVPQSELMALGNDEDLIEELIDIFAAYRLLTLDHDPASRRPTVEIAHEALLREWERLRGWLADSRDDLYQHRRLQILTAEWLGAGRVDGLLLRQARLDQFAAWADATDLALSEAERDYLEASVAARQARQSDEAERQQRELETAQKLAETEGQRAEAQGQANRRLRLLAVGLAIILLVAIAASLFAKEQSRRAEQQARLATARELVRASAANLEVDSERGILLALEAINTTRNVDGIVLPEAEEILHSAVQSHRLRLAINDEGQSKEFLTFDPSGNRIVTWGNYPDALGTMQVWDAHSGEPLSSFPGFYAGVHWSKADQLASITIAPDGLVQHNWDPGSGEELSTVPFSPVGEVINGNQNWDSTLAAIVLADGRIEIRDAATANLLTLLGPPEESSNGIVRFSRNGEYLVGGHFGGLVRVWDLTNGELLFKFPGHAGDVSDIEFSPDDTFFVTGSGDATAKIWDTNSGELLAILVGHTNDISSVAINSAGNLVATAGWDRQIKIWNLQASLATGAGKELLTLHGHPAAIRWVEFNPDGTELASVGLDGSIRFWDLGYGAGSEGPVFVNGPEMPTVLTAVIELTADGKRLIATNFNETPKIWDIENEELLFTLEGHEGSVQFLDLSSDQSLIATSGSDHTVRIWDATTGRNLLTIGDAGCDRCKVVFGPEGKRLAVATELGASILILDLQAMLSSEALNTSEILSADSFELFEIPVNPELNYWYSVVEFNLDGTQIVTGAPGNKVAFWDTNTGEMVNTLSGHEAPVSDIVYSPDGSLIVTSGIDGTARIWDAASGEPLHTLSGHNSSVWSPQFSPDMSTLATASSDGTVKLWDLATGELKLTLYGHTSLVTDLAFSPDGLRLYTASNDGTSRTYLLDLDDLIALAESRVTRSLTDDECREFLHMAACSPDR